MLRPVKLGILSKSLNRAKIKSLSIRITAFSLLAITVFHLPLLWLYPKYNESVKRNISEEYFHTLAYDMEGDCYRISRNFMRECPFETREVHLSSVHTIVEIEIKGKWFAYDPLYRRFFDKQNAAQLSFDINRGYVPESMLDYPYVEAFKDIYYYHNWYYVLLKKVNPYYNKLIIKYYSIS